MANNKQNHLKLSVSAFLISALLGCAPELQSIGDPQNTESDSEKDAGSTVEPSDANCLETDTEFFNRAIWPTLSTTCIACHNQALITGNSPALAFNTDAATAFNQVTQYIASHSDTFVNKPTQNGVNHAGGSLLVESSTEASNFAAMVLRVEQPVASCIDDGETIAREAGFVDVTNMNPARTLRKAAILMQGRLPTNGELNTASSEAGLANALAAYLQGEEFDNWLMNSANDHLLTRKYFTGQTEAQEALNADTYSYSGLNERTSAAFDAAEEAEAACAMAGGVQEGVTPPAACVQAQAARDFASEVYQETNRALAEEPLQLIRHVVNNNRPYSEILTADYMMMNPFTYDALDGASWSTSYDDMDETDWRPGHVRKYRLNWNTTLQAGTDRDYLPSAGILTSPVFLARYPSTDTNRNRARARWTYYYFLGVDIERLAVRAMDAEELKNVTNPGAENTSCYGCHIIMDPVAGAYQSWGNTSQFLVRDGQDSLPAQYVENHPDYQDGDQWYRGQILPGFNGTNMPVANNFGQVQGHDDGLQWLAEQMVTDPRFATGTVKFWFNGVFGREPLLAPLATTDADYQARLLAYQDEQALIEQWASDFRANDYNLKTLLVDMMLSPLFRGELAQNASALRLQSLEQLGLGRLLTPEQLQRKIDATLGFEWREPWQDESKLLKAYYMFYGGIDSDGITQRPDALNSMMYSVVERFANEISCEVVAQEFWPGMPKRLFTAVDITTDPTTAQGEADIRSAIDNLMWRLWGITDVAEQDALWQLYKAIYDQRIAWTLDDDSNGGVYVSNNLSYSVQWDNNRSDERLDEECRFHDYDETDGVSVEVKWEGIDWQDPASIRAHLGSNYNPEQTLRPWVAVLAVMLTDIQFITE